MYSGMSRMKINKFSGRIKRTGKHFTVIYNFSTML